MGSRIRRPDANDALTIEGCSRHAEPGEDLDLGTAGQQVQLGFTLAQVETVGPVASPLGGFDLDAQAVGHQVVVVVAGGQGDGVAALRQHL